jgi:hypothetical protein
MDSLHGAPYSGVNGFINNKQHRFSRTDAASVFKRVAERRGYEISTLTMTSVHAILEEISDLTGEIISASTVQNSGKMVEALLLKQYEIICDPESPSGKKRRAHDISSEIFRLIDVHVNDKESTESTETMRKKQCKRELKLPFILRVLLPTNVLPLLWPQQTSPIHPRVDKHLS